MATFTDADKNLISQIWLALAQARIEYWSDRTVNRAIDLIAWRLSGDYTIEELGAALLTARQAAAERLGVPPWNG